jgi:pimeloyl-ACP methyl ester carboxylesterase
VRRLEVVCAALGLAAIALATWWAFAASRLRREEVVNTQGCELRMTILGPDYSPNKAIAFPGLTANRRTLFALGRSLMPVQVFLLDHPGHGDSTQSFTYERAEFCAAAAITWLEKERHIDLARTALIGHSMGAGIAIRLADQFPTAATISISTAMRKPIVTSPPGLEPVEPPRRMPVNLLLINAEYDWPELKEVSRRLVQAAGGERYSDDDFAQRRAVRSQIIPRATHTSLIFDPEAETAVRYWIERSLGQDSLIGGGTFVVPATAFFGVVAMLLVFPRLATVILSPPGSESGKPTSTPPAWKSLGAWLAAALLAVLIQFGFVALAPVIRMYNGDYLASVLMLTGLALLMSRSKWGGPKTDAQWNARAVSGAIALGMATMLAFGGWLNSHVADLWLNAPRWWRFAVLVPLVLPYFLAEELALGPPLRTWLARSRRAATFLALRAILWLAMVGAVLMLNSGQVLMALLVVYMAAFSISQRLGMDAVRRRTGSAAAAAVFGAILAAWFIAAVFPLT